MRKVIFALIVSCLLVVSSCQKTDIISGPGGYWTYNSNTYPAINCVLDSTNFTLSAFNTVIGGTYSNIVVYFFNAVPDTGSYIIAASGNLSAANQAAISLSYQTSSATSYYGSIITENAATQATIIQKIKVTKANGKLGVSGTGIYISPTTVPFDTIPLSFNLTQTQ